MQIPLRDSIPGLGERGKSAGNRTPSAGGREQGAKPKQWCARFLKDGESGCKHGDKCFFPHLTQDLVDEINRAEKARAAAKPKAKGKAKPKAKAGN